MILNFKPKKTLLLHQEEKLTSEHIKLRPTRLCLSLLLVSFCVWVGAVNYQVNVAYLVCFWIVCFIGVGVLLTRRQLLGLQLNVLYTEEIFAGQIANATIHFKSSDKRSRLFWWYSEHDNNLAIQWHRILLSGSLNDEPQATAIWPIPVWQRGYFPQPLCLRIGTSAPFGLFAAECQIQWQSNAIVYAAPLEHQDFGTQATPNNQQTPQQAGMHGDDIAYLKNHQQGNSLQHVAWKVYAKRGEMMDKVFDEPPPNLQKHTISYTDYPAGTPHDTLASLLTYRVLQAEKAGSIYTLELPKINIAPQNQQREKSLSALALM